MLIFLFLEINGNMNYIVVFKNLDVIECDLVIWNIIIYIINLYNKDWYI